MTTYTAHFPFMSSSPSFLLLIFSGTGLCTFAVDHDAILKSSPCFQTVELPDEWGIYPPIPEDFPPGRDRPSGTQSPVSSRRLPMKARPWPTPAWPSTASETSPSATGCWHIKIWYELQLLDYFYYQLFNRSRSDTNQNYLIILLSVVDITVEHVFSSHPHPFLLSQVSSGHFPIHQYLQPRYGE